VWLSGLQPSEWVAVVVVDIMLDCVRFLTRLSDFFLLLLPVLPCVCLGLRVRFEMQKRGCVKVHRYGSLSFVSTTTLTTTAVTHNLRRFKLRVSIVSVSGFSVSRFSVFAFR
jgi:hypothetical protein